MFLLAHICWDSNIFAQCDKMNAFVFSLNAGYAKTGVVFGMEAGLWPIAGRVGILAGPVLYTRQEVVKGKIETITDLDFGGRLVFKLTDLGDNSPQMLTLYGTCRGMIGGSLRMYLSISESDLISVEPFYTNRTGPGFYILFTSRL